MKQTIKINYLKETRIEKIFVFIGRSYTDDSAEPFKADNLKAHFKTDISSLSRLFKEDSNHPYFKDIFSESEKQNIERNNIDVIFSEIEINLDDTIDVIKRKIIIQMEKQISFNEIYLYGLQKNKLSISRIYKELTQDGKLELTQAKLFQYLLNIKNTDLSDIDLTDLPKKDVYSYEDLILLGIDNEQFLMKKPLGQHFQVNEKYHFTVKQ